MGTGSIWSDEHGQMKAMVGTRVSDICVHVNGHLLYGSFCGGHRSQCNFSRQMLFRTTPF